MGSSMPSNSVGRTGPGPVGWGRGGDLRARPGGRRRPPRVTTTSSRRPIASTIRRRSCARFHSCYSWPEDRARTSAARCWSRGTPARSSEPPSSGRHGRGQPAAGPLPGAGGPRSPAPWSRPGAPRRSWYGVRAPPVARPGSGRSTSRSRVSRRRRTDSRRRSATRSCSEQDHQLLRLPVDVARLGAFPGIPSGYEVVIWGNRAPDDLVEAYAAMHTQMGRDAPSGEVDHQPVEIDRRPGA